MAFVPQPKERSCLIQKLKLGLALAVCIALVTGHVALISRGKTNKWLTWYPIKIPCIPVLYQKMAQFKRLVNTNVTTHLRHRPVKNWTHVRFYSKSGSHVSVGKNAGKIPPSMQSETSMAKGGKWLTPVLLKSQSLSVFILHRSNLVSITDPDCATLNTYDLTGVTAEGLGSINMPQTPVFSRTCTCQRCRYFTQTSFLVRAIYLWCASVDC